MTGDGMSQDEMTANLQRRRRRSSGSAQRRGRAVLWGDPRIDRVVRWTMIGIAVAYVGLGMRASFRSTRDFGMVSVGSPRVDVRYTMGAPTRAGTDPLALVPSRSSDGAMALPAWGYDLDGGRRYDVRFGGADGNDVDQLSCEEQTMVAGGGCPEKLGIALGTPEEEIWYRLGAPASQVYAGDVKRLHYPELGTTYHLKRLMLFKVQLNEREDRLSGVARAVRYLLP